MELRTWKISLKSLSAKEYEFLREMCHLSKNVYNESIYNVRQHYFAEGTYLRYEANFGQMKYSENYINLGSNISQQSMRAADQSFKSFFALKKKAERGEYEGWKVRLPRYLDKDAFYPVVFSHAGEADLSKGRFKIPVSKYFREKYNGIKAYIDIPEYIRDKKVHVISVVPKHNGKYFEARFVFEDTTEPVRCLNPSEALAIDLGVNNLCTCVTSVNKAFILDGKKLKSINQWYNKENTRLSSERSANEQKKWTKRQYMLARKRNRRIDDIIYKTSKYIINYCLDNNIGNIVIGYNDGFQEKVNIGKVNNQKFSMIPYGKLKNRIKYLCDRTGIRLTLQEESYTSKASFYDADEIPGWNPVNSKEGIFSGKRIYRGTYRMKNGQEINADVNGALNILRKSNVVSLNALYSSGVVLTPTRVRIL